MSVIEEQVRPLLAVDRGGIEVVEVREADGAVVVRYLGRCAGCPVLTTTHAKVVTPALLASSPLVRTVEYTILSGEDGVD